MKNIAKKIKTAVLTIVIVAAISLTCFAIDQKLRAVYAYPDYEALSIFENYPWGPFDQEIIFF